MANGNPEPLYFWHKESAHLLMFPGHQYGKYNVSNDGRLTITNLARPDQGYYLCSAISTVGSTMSRTYLKILDRNDVPPPRIRLGATNQTLPLDTKAFLPCEATSSLSVISNMIDADPITTQWLYNQIPIHNDSRFQITRTGLHIQSRHPCQFRLILLHSIFFSFRYSTYRFRYLHLSSHQSIDG